MLPIGDHWSPDWSLAGPLLLQQVYVFTLVLFRLSGLMGTAPGWNHPAVPMNVRALVLFSMALVVTPNIPSTTPEVVALWDHNRDGWLEPHELPVQLLPKAETLRWQVMPDGSPGIPAERWQLALTWPASLLDYAWIAAGEFSLGLVLGWGAFLVISALQLAGQMLDQQTGVGLGQIFNPLFDEATSVSSELLHWLALTVLFAIGGHLLLLRTLLETFRMLPIGYGCITPSTVSLLSDLVTQSLAIGLQISAPVLAAQTLLSLAMGFLGHTVPQINILVFGFPVRILAGGLVLFLAVSGMLEHVVDLFPGIIESLGTSFLGEPPQ